MKRLQHLLIASFSLGILFPLAAHCDNQSDMWGDVIRDVSLPSDSEIDDMSDDDIVAKIISIRGEAMQAALKKGHNALLNENVGGRNGAVGRSWVTMQESIRDSSNSNSRDNSRAKIVQSDDGESIAACRRGTLSAVAVDPSRSHVDIDGLKNLKNGTVYLQMCAGEEFVDKDFCHVDIQVVAGRARQVAVDQWKRQFKGYTHKVVFAYAMKDPKNFEGCSTLAGFRRLVGETGPGSAEELAIRSVPLASARPRFDAAVMANRKRAVFAACTDLTKLTTTPYGYSATPIDDDFADVLRNRYHLKESEILQDHRDSNDSDSSSDSSDDLTGSANDPFSSNFKSPVANATRDFLRRNPALSRRLSPLSVCSNRNNEEDLPGRGRLTGPGLDRFRNNSGIVPMRGNISGG